MDFRTIYTPQQALEGFQWFLEGDLSYVSLDTETMGKNWFRVMGELRYMPTPNKDDVVRLAEAKFPAIEKLTKNKGEKVEEYAERKAAWKVEDDRVADRRNLFKMEHFTTPVKAKKAKEAELKECSREALDPKTCHLATLQVASEDDRVLIVVLKDDHVKVGALKFIQKLQALKVVWVLHNAKFDFHQLAHHWGVRFDDQTIHDTQICEALIKGGRDSGSVSLIQTCQNHSAIPVELRKQASGATVSDWWTEPLTDEQSLYAARDVAVLRHVRVAQVKLMTEMKLLRVRKLECQLTPRLVRVEETGVQFDKEKLMSFMISGKERQEKELNAYASVFDGIKYTEAAQVLVRIKEHYEVTPLQKKWDKEARGYVEQESVDKFALLAAGLIEEPAIKAYLTLKEIGKKISDAQKWHVMDDFKVSYFQVPSRGNDDKSDDGGARTGRMSTSPQLQNLSNFMKQFIVAPEGWTILSSDYAGIELRLMASYANVQVLKDIFKAGISPHVLMCSRINGIPMEEVNKKSKEYRIAKEISFGFLYGMGGATFCNRVLRSSKGETHLTEQEGWDFRAKFFEQYPEVKNFHQLQHAIASLQGYTESASGRRRYYDKEGRPQLEKDFKAFPNPLTGCWVNHNQDAAACWLAADWKWMNIAKNMPIQGSGADGSKQGVIRTVDAFTELNRHGSDVARMFGIVHDSQDSIVRDDYIDKALKIHDDAMKQGMALYLKDVPIEVEHTTGRCWSGAPVDILNDDYGLWEKPRFNTETVDGKLQLTSEAKEEYEKWKAIEFQTEITVS